MANTGNGKISLANILALFGLACIGIGTFFGIVIKSSNGAFGEAIILTIALIAALGFFLFLGIKAKRAKDNPDKWRYVEWISIAIYIVIALVFSAPFLRSFYVISQSDEMLKKAREEVAAIKEMRSKYEDQQRKYLDDAVEQIKNYKDSRQSSLKYNDDLAEYVKGIGNNVDSAGGWKTKASICVKLQPDKELSAIDTDIENWSSWNVLSLSSIASRLEAKDKESWTSIEKKIREYGEKNKLIPVIGGGVTEAYYLKGLAKFELGTPPEPQFAKSLRDADGSTFWGWIVYIALNLLVLLNYVVTIRSNFVGPRRGVLTGGADL